MCQELYYPVIHTSKNHRPVNKLLLHRIFTTQWYCRNIRLIVHDVRLRLPGSGASVDDVEVIMS